MGRSYAAQAIDKLAWEGPVGTASLSVTQFLVYCPLNSMQEQHCSYSHKHLLKKMVVTRTE